MANSLVNSTAMHTLWSDRQAFGRFFQNKSLGHTRRKITERKNIRTGRAFRLSLINGPDADLNGAYSQIQSSRTIFPGGFKRAEVRLPGLALRVKAAEVLQDESILQLIDLAVTDGVTIVVLESVGDATVDGGQLYEAACALKALLRGRACLLIAERVDIAAAAGASGVVLSDRGLPAIIARNMMQSSGSEWASFPLVARAVRSVQSAQDATASEGADLLILVIDGNEDAEMLDRVCEHVSVPVFAMFGSFEWSTMANVSNKLAKSGASGLVIATEHIKHFGDGTLNQLKGLLSSIKLTDKKSKEHAVYDFPGIGIVNGDVSGNAIKGMQKEATLDIQAKEILDEERPLLSKAISLLHEATPQMEEVSLLADAVVQLDELFSLVIVGEFNSGKSTVINALLGKRYLKEGVVPTTNEITVLCYSGDGSYGEERSERHPDGHFIRYLPASLLKQRVFRNFDPSLHNMARAHEYVRALNAAKLEKIFAKPFLGAMEGHIDAVSCMAKDSHHLKHIFSGSMDGDVRLWDISSRRTIEQFPGHRGAVRGLTVSTDGKHLISCGDDCIVRLWEIPVAGLTGDSENIQMPVASYVGKNAFRAVDHQWENDVFATAGAQVDIWDHNRSEPINSFSWGSDTVISIRFNPAEKDIFATTASDRSIVLYDLRMASPLNKLIMRTRNNAIAWNPREPFNFTAANEDCNCYSYDMRRMNMSTCVHQDHVSAVMDVDYSPTGREFVTGSYDRTVRIFPYNGGHSREIYHTKRMQRVFCVKYSCDATYVLSGSDDTNLRLWKAKASEQLGVLLPREHKNHEYLDAVKERFKHLPEIKRIDRHRHLPKPIYKAAALRRTVTEAEKKKEDRKRAHSAPGSVVTAPLRKRRIIAELE